MKLSEAIREGSKLRPQTVGKGYFWKDSDGQVYSCAAAAAYEGIGATNGDDYFRGKSNIPNLSDHFETTIDPMVLCPEKEKCDYCEFEYAGSLVIHLNDYHEWTREAIADFMETLGL